MKPWIRSATKVMARMIYNAMAVFPVDRRKVVYLSFDGRVSDNPKAVFERWKERQGFTHVWIIRDKLNYVRARKLFGNDIVWCKYGSMMMLYHLATAKYWIFNTHVPLCLRPRKETVYVQLWHAAGAFKKFRQHIGNPRLPEKRLKVQDAMRWDVLLCSCHEIVDIYASAFGGISKSKVFVCGLPRTDAIFRMQHDKDRLKGVLGIPDHRALVLFAPTFRDTRTDSSDYVRYLGDIAERLPAEYFLAVRLHPGVTRGITLPSGILDLSGMDDLESILCATDILISDYSSIIFDFSLLQRPMLFFVPDLERYKEYRDFYYEYESFVPGPICKDVDELIEALSTYRLSQWEQRILDFARRFHDSFDGENSRRVLEYILQIEK